VHGRGQRGPVVRALGDVRTCAPPPQQERSACSYLRSGPRRPRPVHPGPAGTPPVESVTVDRYRRERWEGRPGRRLAPHRKERRGRGLSSSPETSTASICPYRALPGYMIDLIRDGVRWSKLRAGGDRAVFTALVRTAASAQQRGHTYPQWAELISRSAAPSAARPGRPAGARNAARLPTNARCSGPGTRPKPG
jgi:hypothetical protein